MYIYYFYMYSTFYKGNFTKFAHLVQESKKLNYQMRLLPEIEYFISLIIEDDQSLVAKWLDDIRSIAYINPQGQLIQISEQGKYADFISKVNGILRLDNVSYDLMSQTKETLFKYKEALEKSNHPLAFNISLYLELLGYKFEGYNLTRKNKMPK